MQNMVEEKLKPKMVALTKMLVSLGAGKVQVLACWPAPGQ